MVKKFFVILNGIFISIILFSQSSDLGFWTTFELEKKIGKLDIEFITDFRTKNKMSEFHRLKIELEASYKLFKPVKVGGGYSYMYFNDSKYNDIQPRQRYFMFIQGRQKFGNFRFSLREQVQRTIKDEGDRITESGYDSYRINPVWIWRNRLKAEYSIPKFPVTPGLSLESFYSLNDTEGNSFVGMRYKLSFKYKINKHHKLSVYSLIDKEINIDDPNKLFVGGLKYTYSF